MKWMICLLTMTSALLAATSPARAEEPAAPPVQREEPEMLPDWSEGRIGLLGPFIWSRALDLGEDARFSDEHGRASHTGEYLWTHQYARLPRKKGLKEILHARNNFVSRDANLAFTVQPVDLLLQTSGLHNSKIIMGYVQTQPRLPFTHADNADLAHLAAGDRVCLFIPVRPDPAIQDPLDPKRYRVNTIVGIQPICVVQFGAGEMIHYEWFKDADNLDKHVLMNLAPYFDGENELRPAVTKPLFRFDVDGKGGWTVRVERDGRDGLDGGEVDGDWDLTFTHESKGAKPYTVNVTKDNSAWALSLFSPGGKPMETSEILLGLKPYDRLTGNAAAWPDRRERVRDVEPRQIPQMLKAK